MSSRFSHTSSLAKVIIIVEFFLVAYLVYSLTKNVYNSYQVDKTIEAFEAENAQIEEENRQKTEDYLYVTSEEYIDKIAKQELLYINPGEEVIVIIDEDFEDPLPEEELNDDVAKYNGQSNPEKWWEFFFGS